MISKGKKNLLGVYINAIDYEAAECMLIEAAKKKQSFAMSALAVHGVMTGVLDSEHRYRLNQLDLVTPDGQPVKIALNLLHKVGLPDRVCGPALASRVCERAAKENLPIYLYGSKQDTLDLLVSNLERKFPGIKIAGVEPSKFRNVSPNEKLEIIDRINQSGAKLLLVGLGCPRQEIWVYEHKRLINMPMMAVGAAFDFHAGKLSTAPKFMQDLALEWFYRLIQEPKRLWKRYLLLNPHYMYLVFCQYMGFHKYESDTSKKPNDDLFLG